MYSMVAAEVNDCLFFKFWIRTNDPQNKILLHRYYWVYNWTFTIHAKKLKGIQLHQTFSLKDQSMQNSVNIIGTISRDWRKEGKSIRDIFTCPVH